MKPIQYLEYMGDEIHELYIEIGTDIKLKVEGLSSAFNSKLIGMEQGKYLILKIPQVTSVGGAIDKFNAGNQIIVRYVYDGDVFGFEVPIICSILRPARLIFIAYPHIVEEHKLRNDKRIQPFLPLVIKFEQEGIEGSINDISSSGCRFRIKTSELQGKKNLFTADQKKILAYIKLPGIEKELQFFGRQKNVKKNKNKTEVGIEFIDIDEEAQKKLHNYLKANK